MQALLYLMLANPNRLWHSRITLRSVAMNKFIFYNFARTHSTLRVAPAMEAGIASHVWSIEKIVNLLGDIEQKKAA